jgi:predicted acetyltransferase
MRWPGERSGDKKVTMTQTYPIRAIGPDELTTLADVDAHAFLEPWPDEAIERERITTEFDRTFAAFDGEQMVGSGANYSFQLTVPGGVAPAAGVTAIAVLPSHRRRGILTSMMGHLFADAAARSEPLAILFASEAGIYSRFGFGPGSMELHLTVRRGEGRLAPGGVAAGQQGAAVRLRAAEPEAARADLVRVFDAELGRRPGMLARDERWWTYLLTDPPAMRPARTSPVRCLLAEDDAGPRGYALYWTSSNWSEHLAEGVVEVHELYATDPAATAALWSDLLSRDLVGETRIRRRPVDEPLLAMLADPRRGRAALTDGLWVRVLDVPDALARRRYAAPADLVLEITDPLIAANDGRWRLRAGGPSDSGASCDRTGDAADVRLTVQALGTAYLGGGQLSQLAAAGHAAELTPGALARLGTALSWDRPPYSGMVF